MRTLGNVYPWDVDGDPAAAERIAGLGFSGVTLAAAYHSVRAVTPLHPRHRIVTWEAAACYVPDPGRWRCARLRPPVAVPAGSFGRAAAALRAAGLPVTAWVVLTHNSRLGAADPACTVENAFGDSYPWALCAAVPAVREYAAMLAAEVAALPEADAVELEACGWYGVTHGSAHDKAVLPGGPAADWLLSVCFCRECQQAYAAAGGEPARVRASVRATADRLLAGAAAGLPGEVAGVVDTARAALARRFLTGVLAAVRAAAPGKPVYVHADPDPRAAGASPGYDPGFLLGPGGADGAVLSCWQPAIAPALVSRTVRAAPAGVAVAASLLAVAGLGGDPGTLAAQAAAVRAAGATELRIYHAGLAAPADLAAIRALCQARFPGPAPAPQQDLPAR